MENERSVETTAETVEEAIAKGLKELGAEPYQVIVEVLEEPSRGVFGLGARLAKVKLQMMAPPKPPEPRRPTPVVEPEPEPEPLPVREERAPTVERRSDDDYDYDDDDETSVSVELAEEISEDQLNDDAKIGRDVLKELLEHMKFEAVVVVRRSKDERTNNAPWVLDVTADERVDLTTLIGRRGETLASLQYLTRLISSRELQRRANIIVDVDGYKSRRADRLERLAERMADQAVESKRMVSLEPMPPHERRIIHMTLRRRDDVQTKSIGEGNARKVTIVPKETS